MDFSLNDIQEMMRDGASRFIQKEYDFETRRKLAKSDIGYDAEKLGSCLPSWLACPAKCRRSRRDRRYCS
ncbi:MAG: hypothetical protein ACFHHU_18575 [Porticoccaceae bacterium]